MLCIVAGGEGKKSHGSPGAQIYAEQRGGDGERQSSSFIVASTGLHCSRGAGEHDDIDDDDDDHYRHH